MNMDPVGTCHLLHWGVEKERGKKLVRSSPHGDVIRNKNRKCQSTNHIKEANTARFSNARRHPHGTQQQRISFIACLTQAPHTTSAHIHPLHLHLPQPTHCLGLPPCSTALPLHAPPTHPYACQFHPTSYHDQLHFLMFTRVT